MALKDEALAERQRAVQQMEQDLKTQYGPLVAALYERLNASEVSWDECGFQRASGTQCTPDSQSGPLCIFRLQGQAKEQQEALATQQRLLEE